MTTTSSALRLVGRSSSHFTRVARMFAHELGVPLELLVVHDLMSHDATTFHGNPALKIPTLLVGASVVFGTDNICRKLVEHAGRTGDPRIVLSEHVTDDVARNAQELIWQAMALQVQVRVGIELAKLPADNQFFTKATASLSGALVWLDQHVEDVIEHLPRPRAVSVLEVTLFCLLEHLAFRPTVPLGPFPTLRAFAAAFAARESAGSTTFHFDSRQS